MSTTSSSRPLPRPLRLVSNSTGTSGLPTPLSASAHGPLSAPLSLNRNGINDLNLAKHKPSPRRQSSISYNTSLSKAQSPGLGRSNSLGSNVILGGESSCGNENSAPKQSPKSPIHDMRESEPVTLAEKHADLLRFIAQKESKCLELRTQLAQHEADLLLLKRKWERIVSKGSPLSSRSDAPTNVGSDMLDGIREGVQSGLEKVFAVLEPSSAGPSSTPQPPTSAQPLKSRRHSQYLTRETSAASSNKRASASTASSTSTLDHSSPSGSRSSASSLFDELSLVDRQSLASSIEGDSTTRPNLDTDETLTTTRSRNSPSIEPSTIGTEEEDDPSSKRRRSRPSSMNLSQFTSPLSASSTPLRQVANWVPPGLNKKWEELKGNETLSKQSKRASILLNDMLAVLAPPIPPSPRTSSSFTPVRKGTLLQSPSQHTLDSVFFDPAMGASLSIGSGSVRKAPSPSPSLLDEEDECSMGDVLLPEVKVPGVSKEANESKTDEGKEEEEWNW